MTDDELAQVKALVMRGLLLPRKTDAEKLLRASQLLHAAGILLTEVERLRAFVREVAQGVGAGSAIEFDPWGGIYAEDVVRKARALLGLDSDHASDQS